MAARKKAAKRSGPRAEAVDHAYNVASVAQIFDLTDLRPRLKALEQPPPEPEPPQSTVPRVLAEMLVLARQQSEAPATRDAREIEGVVTRLVAAIDGRDVWLAAEQALYLGLIAGKLLARTEADRWRKASRAAMPALSLVDQPRRDGKKAGKSKREPFDKLTPALCAAVSKLHKLRPHLSWTEVCKRVAEDFRLSHPDVAGRLSHPTVAGRAKHLRWEKISEK